MNHRLVLSAAAWWILTIPAAPAKEESTVAAGRLDAVDPSGKILGTCPLKHTAVDAELSGTIARVTVTQQFHNPFREKIEAIYGFPLHQDSAVDAMTMKVGDRVVKGIIKERDEARRIYTEAKARGKIASLLDQERPNIFTQSVANIEPGQQVTITIRYSQMLAWKDGRFEFDFPTVVGPRYIPGSPSATAADAMPSMFSEQAPQRGPQGEPPVANPQPVPPTDQVPDADRITPPVAMEGFRAGHDLSMTVRIQAGLPISDLKSTLHEITVEHPDGDATRAVVRLKEGAALPDRDFVLGYRTAGDQITDTVLTHTDERGKFFTLVLQPPARVKPDEVVPRELIFVLDTSGSMSGFPLETSKSLMRRAIENLRPADRFNLITFAGDTTMMAPKPLDNTESNRHRALQFIDTLQGGGGTEMMKAIETALGADLDPNKVRIVCYLTDGYVGNDMAIIGAVKRHARTTRVFGFGIGSSVNRFLLDGMARAGKGDVQYVPTHDEAEKSAARFYERIDAPVLTDVRLDFGGLAVEQVYPEQPEDLFACQPVVVRGRYTKAGEGVISLTGRNAAGAWQRNLTVRLPGENPENSVLAPQWARAKVDHLMMRETNGVQSRNPEPSFKQEIIGLGTTYELLTQFTSFVAVEETHTTEGGTPRIIQVPLEMPKGISQSGVFGQQPAAPSASMAKVAACRVPVPANGTSSPSTDFGDGDDFGSGWGSGEGSGGFGNIPATMKKRCSKADRLERLAANGGTPQCEDAVVKSLDWLKHCQNKDGSWCDTHRTAATGMALLAYLGHCETPLSEQYGESALRAMVYLIGKSTAQQGRLTDDPNDPRWLYEHAIATTALAEACTFNKQLQLNVPGLDDAVRLAGQSLIDSALPTGGWILPAKGKAGAADTLLTCLNLQALKACKHTGLDFRNLSKCVKSALAAIKERQDAPGALALAYQQWAQGSAPVAVTACETITKQPAFRWESPDADLRTLYFNSHVMLNAGGPPWSAFNAAVLPELLNAQALDGSFKSAGTPDGAPSDLHFRTCLATLTLEVYYRFLPGIGQKP